MTTTHGLTPLCLALTNPLTLILQCSVPMARMELLDEVQMRACNLYRYTHCSAVIILQCSTVQYNAVQCNAVQCSTMQYSIMQCSAVQWRLFSGLSYPETPHLFLEFHGSEEEVSYPTP